jgi:Bax protein
MTRPQRWLAAFVAVGVPLLTAGSIAGWITSTPHQGTSTWPVYLLSLYPGSAEKLDATFRGYQYAWPPTAVVPPLGLDHLPRDLHTLDPSLKKNLFLRALLPLVLAANNRIRRQREYIVHTLNRAGPDSWPKRLLHIAAEYDIHDSLNQPATRIDLMRRCDIVPPALVLAQAAQESGWGTSGFALQGNNLFGMHTWNPARGLKAGADSAQHPVLIRTYPDLRASVRSYIHNLNVGHAYVAFRELRARQKKQGKMDAIALARTLGSYSQLGQRYTRHIQHLIRNNHLDRLPRLYLARDRLFPRSSLQGNDLTP